MTKLNQIVALEKGVKSTLERAITTAYHLVQKPEPFAGRRRVYEAKDDEDGEVLPGENQKVVAHVPAIIEDFTVAMSRLIDVLSTKIEANTKARADVVLEDGTVLLKDVPIEGLLLLESRLTDCRTFVGKMPTLDPNYDWHWEDTSECWASTPAVTNRGKKIPRAFVKAPSTDKHPAQVDVIMEDVIVGTWTTTMLSGAMPLGTVTEYKRRIDALLSAVKMAREAANMADVKDVKYAKRIFEYLWAAT